MPDKIKIIIFQLQDQLVNININNNPNINLNIKNSYVEVLNNKQASSTALFRTSNLIHMVSSWLSNLIHKIRCYGSVLLAVFIFSLDQRKIKNAKKL